MITPRAKELRVAMAHIYIYRHGSSHKNKKLDQEVLEPAPEWPQWPTGTAEARGAADSHSKAKGMEPTPWAASCFSGGRPDPPEPNGSLRNADGTNTTTIRQSRVGTGCKAALGFTDHDGRLAKRRKASVVIQTAAVGACMNASYSGGTID